MNARKPIRIVVVDDHTILRDGIVSVLDAQSDFEVVGVAGSVAGAVATVQQAQPDVVLMDYSLPDGTGLDATRAVLASHPQTDIVLLTMHEDDDLLFSAVRGGAKGYLLKNISAKELLSNLRGLADGHHAFAPAQTSRILSEFARTKTAPTAAEAEDEPDPLTERELEVLQWLVTGASNREIAVQLHISVHTVKNHLHHILEKLKVENRKQAAEVARKKRLIPPQQA